MTGPLLTSKVHETLLAAARDGTGIVHCSLDLELSTTSVEVGPGHWSWKGQSYPFLAACKERTIYYWAGEGFQPAARYTHSLIKLVPTEWGPPTFEIDGIKMLPTAQVSPFADAERKVGFIRPRGKVILDTCGGLGYFASWCLRGQAAEVQSYEKSPDVIWLRGLNPWSPEAGGRLTLANADVSQAIVSLPSQSFDAVLHDPPRFGIAGELYSQSFYDQIARVLKPRGVLFQNTGTPNKLTSGRDVPNEVSNRLRTAGFSTEVKGDGILAVRGRAGRRPD
jgi:predicted methyltransferase